MDSFELNKIAGAVLATALLVMALSITSEIIYQPEDLREDGYVIAVTETEAPEAEAAAAVAPIEARLQTADVAAGQAAAKKCQACHTFDKGGPAKVGPNLYGIVGNDAGHMEGFKYSDAMMGRRSEGVTWTFAELDEFLTNPKADVPGTLMAFVGLRKPDERADVIAYLRTLSDAPVPLPEPPAAAAPEGEATPATDGAAASGAAAGPPEAGTNVDSGDAGSTMPQAAPEGSASPEPPAGGASEGPAAAPGTAQ